MSNIKKTRVAIFPYFQFEAAISTFFDSKNYEIIPVSLSEKNITEKYAQGIFGNWCAPLKLIVASFEKLILEENVTKVIGLNYQFCRYPFVLGNINQWINNKDFEYLPIIINSLEMNAKTLLSIISQLKIAVPNFVSPQSLIKLKIAKERYFLADKFRKNYLKTMPICKNPTFLRKKFLEEKAKFLNLKTADESKKIVNNFKSFAKKQISLKEPKYRILISGDAEVITMEFCLLELDLFLAKFNAEIIKSDFGYANNKKSLFAQQARKILSDIFSSKTNRVSAKENHIIELSTLFHILKGKSIGIDGMIYVKPNMCSPCENVSYVLKKLNYFNIPTVEISYDEHSGINGIITRLEAFMNILAEKK